MRWWVGGVNRPPPIIRRNCGEHMCRYGGVSGLYWVGEVRGTIDGPPTGSVMPKMVQAPWTLVDCTDLIPLCPHCDKQVHEVYRKAPNQGCRPYRRQTGRRSHRSACGRVSHRRTGEGGEPGLVGPAVSPEPTLRSRA